MYVTRFRTYKIALPLQNKNLGGRGPQINKHLPPSTITGQFFKKSRHLGFDVFIDIWSMVSPVCGEQCADHKEKAERHAALPTPGQSHLLQGKRELLKGLHHEMNICLKACQIEWL